MSHLCTAVGGQQFRKEWRKLQMRIMSELYYSFFHYCPLSCRYMMFQKHVLNKPKWGRHKQSLGGGHCLPCPPPPSERRLWSTLWICFVFLYQTYQNPISLYRCSSINLCLTLIFAIQNCVRKQLSSMVLNSFHVQQHHGFS